MAKPVRLQLSRKKGFSLQELSLATNGLPAVNVARPSIFGNPFTVAALKEAGFSSDRRRMHARVVDSFRNWLDGSDRDWEGHESTSARAAMMKNTPSLACCNLACWCRPDDPCHADVLLALANPTCEEVS